MSFFEEYLKKHHPKYPVHLQCLALAYCLLIHLKARYSVTMLKLTGRHEVMREKNVSLDLPKRVTFTFTFLC